MKRPNDSSDAPEARHGTLAKNTYKLTEKDRDAFYSERFCVESRANMHMVSKKDLNFAELETMRTSRSPTTAMTANCEAQTREEATVYVKQLDLFVKVKLLEYTPAVLSLVETL